MHLLNTLSLAIIGEAFLRCNIRYLNYHRVGFDIHVSMCITGQADVLDNLEQDCDDHGNQIDTLQVTLQGKSLSIFCYQSMFMTHC